VLTQSQVFLIPESSAKTPTSCWPSRLNMLKRFTDLPKKIELYFINR